MRKLWKFIVFIIIPIIITGTTYHTIEIDGNNDFDTDEKFNDCSNADNAYFTWDEDYIYFAISDPEADYENMATFMYFDTDPEGSKGTTSAYAWSENITTPFKCDYVVIWRNKSNDDYIEVMEWNGNDWEKKGSNNDSWLNPDEGSDEVYFSVGTDYREVRVKRSYIGVENSTDKISFSSFTEQQWDNNYRYFVFPKKSGDPGDIGDRTSGQSIEHYRGYILGEGYSPNSDGSFDQSLPIELQSFTATADGQKVVLNWETASELDNSGFNIFRSSQENSGYYIINEELIEGAGNSSTKRSYQYIDDQVAPGNQYWYKLQDVSFSGETEMHGPVAAKLQTESNNLSAESYALYPVYPNPFNPATTIRFDMQEQADLNIAIYNLQGQKIKTLVNEDYPGGSNFTVRWNGTDQYGQAVSAGVYLYKMTTSTGFQKIRKMVLVR